MDITSQNGHSKNIEVKKIFSRKLILKAWWIIKNKLKSAALSGRLLFS